MAIRNPSQRVGVFVDVQNLYYSARNIYNSRINFNEILKAAVGDRQLVRASAYVVKADMPDEQTFFDALGKAGFEVKSKDLQTFYGGYQKGDWDVGITVDVIKMIHKLDVVVLCSGDGDFAPLYEYLQFSGQLVEVCAFGKSTSGKVKDLVDNFIDLDQNTKKFLMPIKSKTFRIFGRDDDETGQYEPRSKDAEDERPRIAGNGFSGGNGNGGNGSGGNGHGQPQHNGPNQQGAQGQAQQQRQHKGHEQR